MSSIDTEVIKVNRFSLDKEFVSAGRLTVSHGEQRTTLIFEDEEIEVKASELYHPLVALDSLRKQLEADYQSLLAVNGCRIDVDHRATGGAMCYLIEYGQKATKSIYIFEPTTEISKLCTVNQHETAYNGWLESVLPPGLQRLT